MEYHSGGSLPLLGRPRYCPGANANGGYLCETGHCCGETGCCTYYYELWWFWLLWTALIMFSCCCAYRHRRAKVRAQQQQRRQREISLLAYQGTASYPSSMLDLSFLASLKLPSYEEVAAQPSTPPPPYSSVFTAPRYPQPPRTADPHLLLQHDPLLHRPLSDAPSSLSSDNSSSCSCDSCCPSSPCSSFPSAPLTYETDTSHASTPSELAALPFDVATETPPRAPPSPVHADTAAASKTSSPRPTSPQANPGPPPLVDPEYAPKKPGSPGSSECKTPSAYSPPSTSFLLDPPQPTRPTQAPPKQTLFSPCVDVIRAETDDEGDQDNVDADESQYRHRRLTGDSGIEVCRCRVQGQEAREEDAETESTARGNNSDLHDSVDCPSKCAPTPCHPHEEAGEVVVVVETA
ncbi:WW domain-binding protein 1-like [Phyllopteryx taeniolatus]|uniref:WW domain-binding protein 1-like n=1 Tax=Phyllopteryx taeniolatus TaxID=161469 RepID=UPI002AD502EA|nr:WW domain-binding protein 1-like [Phyllopteryx taeniolatus]XP_061620560.1 WW domain-binding protein 1-like [Phyllopteryx taeniolatus]